MTGRRHAPWAPLRLASSLAVVVFAAEAVALASPIDDPPSAAPPTSSPDAPLPEGSTPPSPVRPGSPVRWVGGVSAAGPLYAPLQAVDPGRADTGGLETSLRSLPFDLRLPTGFERVYRVPGRDDLYMRANGALYAVFSKGVYEGARGREVPLATTDLVYHIGMPEPAKVPAPAFDRPGRIDLRVGSTRPAPTSAAESALPAAPTVAVDLDGPADPTDPWAHLALGPARVERD